MLLDHIYELHFLKDYLEIQHVPEGYMSTDFGFEEDCLMINFSAFEKYYSALMDEVSRDETGRVSEMLLAFNGENGKAWNRRSWLLQEGRLELRRELRVNEAVCMKCKKSSSCYDYRLKLVTALRGSVDALVILREESALIGRILSRFKRNYYCWMYRNKLLNLLLHLSAPQSEALLGLEVELLQHFTQLNPNDPSVYSRLIALKRRHNLPVAPLLAWAHQLSQFCAMAYQHSMSYTSLTKYLEYLDSY